MDAARCKIFQLLKAIVILTCVALSGCGDYKPCEVLAYRICEQCPDPTEAWKAACMCIERNTLKENGYKCSTPEHNDKVLCNIALENWNKEKDCQLFN